MGKNVLVGKILYGIKVSEDKQSILFVTNGGDVIADCDGDCCSYTWIEHIETPALGFPAEVTCVEDLDLPGSDDNHPDHDCLQVYGLKVSTTKGDIVIDYRNSSNGYYGGNLTWPGDYHYGGVYRQNVSNHKWVAVLEDI